MKTEQQKCDCCDKNTAHSDLITLAQRNDGTYYERTDGSCGADDLQVCLDCAEEKLDAGEMTKNDLHKLVDAWEQDPSGFETCDNLCIVLDSLPGQPEGEFSADEIREMIDDSDLEEGDRTAKFGLVQFDIGNLGTEIWLVEHPDAAQKAWYEAVEAGTTGENSPLNEAAAAGGEAIVLRAHWGDDIPVDEEDRPEWLEGLIPNVAAEDREKVREIVENHG